jgi:hypothetical protein
MSPIRLICKTAQRIEIECAVGSLQTNVVLAQEHLTPISFLNKALDSAQIIVMLKIKSLKNKVCVCGLYIYFTQDRV